MKIKISIDYEIDKHGNLLGRTFSARSCRKGPVLRHTFMETTKEPSIELMKRTFDLDRMRREAGEKK